MKTAIVAVLMIAASVSPWVKAEPVEVPAPVVEEAVTVSAEIEASGDSSSQAEPAEDADTITDDGCWEYSATMTITHYCNCARCCGKWAGGPTASGVMPTAGRTVAVDKFVIPLGSEVCIDGTVYIAEDAGVSGYHVDVYCDSHQEALERGMYKTEVCWR